MRAKLVNQHRQWLTGDFEAPPSLKQKTFLAVWRAQRSPDGLDAMKVGRGAGVWDSTGRLMFYLQEAADIVWSRNASQWYSLENRFGPCTKGPGVRHQLRRRELTTYHAVDELELCVPMGGMEYLVINETGTTALATWLDQTQWGYVVVDLAAMKQSSLAFVHPTPSLSPPAFSPDGSVVVSCSHFRNGWWTDAIDDYWDSPSPGGLRKLGTISVQQLPSGEISNHDILVRLPAGWIPDRPTAAEWGMVWGPEFTAAREFELWLPDDSVEVLHLPLPPRIELSRPLAPQRSWLA